MKTISILVTGLQVFADGSGVVLTQKTVQNPNGAFKFSANGMNRLAARAGVPNAHILKHLVALGAQFQFDTEFVKEGQNWTNDRTGETGIYEKDHWRVQNSEVILGDVAKNKLADAAVTAAMSNFGSFSAPIVPQAQPVMVDNDEEEESADEPKGKKGAKVPKV